MSQNSLPTRGQRERELSQNIQTLYRQELGHQPGKVTCQLFGTELAIMIENSITQPEQVLAQSGQTPLAQQVRSDLNKVIQPKFIELIETILQVKVLDFLSDAKFDTERTGILVVLQKAPAVRNPESIPKLKN